MSWTRIIRAVELVVVFFVLPLLYYYKLIPLNPILLLAIITALCLVVLLRDPTFSRHQLWDARNFVRRAMISIAVFIVAGAALTLAVRFLWPDLFLGLMKRNFLLWALVMLLYPVLSVYPQEIVYRAFLFHRYRGIFSETWMLVLVSAVAFAFLHVVFMNLMAVALSFAGGLIFAVTYARTRSLLVTSFEHALYGCLIFTIGLGGYFYHGSVKTIETLMRP